MVAFEVPPGIGKTLLTIGKALELARGGVTVIYALPTHSALATAFAYAVLSFYEMAKKKRRKLPYLVYYEGINRFCPFFTRGSDAVFRYALDYMYARGKVDQVLYERLKDLAVREVATAYGTMFICRNVCPVYRAQKHFPKERVFATENARDIEKQAFPLLPGEVKAYIAEAVKALGKLKKKGLVAYVSPRIEIGKKPDGYCIRAVLQKAVTRKTQIVMKGALILTPIHALDFLHSLVERKVKALQSRGLSIPNPYIIIDEYDFYVYKPAKIPVFSVKQAERELEVARDVIREEVNKRIANDPSYDWERLVAAMIAVLVLQKLLDEYARFVEEKGSGASLELAGSVANFFAEAATEPVVAGGYVVPPLAPRRISLRPIKETLLQIYSILEEEHDEFVKQHGASLYDIAAVKKASLLYFLQLWENVLIIEAKKRGMKFIVPALYNRYGKVYDTGYVLNNRVVSVAKRVAGLALGFRPNYIVILTNVLPIKAPVYIFINGREEKVSDTGLLLSYITYDPKMMKLFSKDSGVVVLLLSATGLPWHFLFFTTRSMGKGIATPKGRQVAADTISPVFEECSVTMSMSKVSTDLYIRGPRMRDVLVVTLSPQALLGYAMHGFIKPMVVPMIPPRNSPKYYDKLAEALSKYVDNTLKIADLIIKYHVKELKKHPAILVLAQRKDVAVVFTAILLRNLRGQRGATAEVCSVTRCERVDKVLNGAEDLADALKRLEDVKASHFVVKLLVKNGMELRIYITWLRSRMSRGVDLPDDTDVYAVLLVGTPYKTPSVIDIVTADIEDIVRGSMVNIPMFIKNLDMARAVIVSHIPIDIAESVNEFVQGVGRALRRAWSVTRENDWNMVYRVGIFIPFYTLNKISTYSPLWFREVVHNMYHE